MIKRTRRTGKAYVQNKKRQGKRQGKSITTKFKNFYLKSISGKMKVPLLILCIAVIYGTCRVYCDNSYSTDPIQYDRDYTENYAIARLENSLSRQKRANLLSPISLISNILSNTLGSGFNALSKMTINILCTVYRMFIEQIGLCPKTEGLSLNLIAKMLNPTQAVRTILCYGFSEIRAKGCDVVNKFLNCVSEFIRKVLLPGLYERLNKMNQDGSLPPCLNAFIIPFNLLYMMLSVSGYVPMLKINLPSIPIL